MAMALQQKPRTAGTSWTGSSTSGRSSGSVPCLRPVPAREARDRDWMAEASIRSYQPGETVFMEGDIPTHFYVVKEGVFKLTRVSLNGHEMITELLFPGDVFDAPSCLDGKPYTVNARNVLGGPGTLAVLPARLMLQDEACKRHCEGQLMGRWHAQREMMAALAFERVEQRVVRAIQVLALRLGTTGPNGLTIPMPLSRQELAEWIGTSTETAIRVLSCFKRHGWLSESAGCFHLPSTQWMDELSHAA